MPVTLEVVTERRRVSRNAALCFAMGLLVACSGEPFTATAGSASAGAGATFGSTAGRPDSGGGRAGSSPEMQAGRAGAPSNGEELAASGGGGVANSDVDGGNGLGGAAGEGEAAGAAGSSADGKPACHHGSGTEYLLKFRAENQGGIEQELHPFFEVQGVNGKSVALSRVKIRYYYTKEVDGSERGSCFWVTGNLCSLVNFEFSDLVPPTSTANRVMEVSFAASNALVGLTPLEVRTGLTVNHGNLEQNNDYSFLSDAGKPPGPETISYRAWDRVTLYVDDELVWGSEPCPSE